MKIVLYGEPRSTSHIYKYTARGGFVRGYMSPEGKALKEDYAWQAKAQFNGDRTYTADLKIDCTLYFGTRRRADIDNFNKLWLDALTGIIWQDDSQIQELKIKKDYDPDKPRIELLIRGGTNG